MIITAVPPLTKTSSSSASLMLVYTSASSTEYVYRRETFIICRELLNYRSHLGILER